MAGASFGHALSTAVKENAILLNGMDVTPETGGLARANLVENIRVYHRSFGKKALICWSDVFELTVKEEAEDVFRNSGQESLLAKDVKSEERVDYGVSRYDPE